MLLDEYILTQFLGKGTFGEVYLTKKKNTDFIYATKRMSKDFVEDPKYIKYFNNEISILKKLYHKNIVRLEALKKTNNHYYVIMEYCNGGTLTECLEKYKRIYHKPFTEEIVQHIMRQIVSAINYIHDLKIIHRDLKLDNILVKYNNEIDKNQINLLKAEVKIIDFGFAAYKDQSGLLKTAIGSPMNMDPLILKKFNSGGTINKELGYDEKADIWSLGTLCYQMLIGNSAFDAYNMTELVSKVEEGTYKVPTNLSKEVVSFLNAMLQYKPEKRLSANQLIRHSFLIKNISDFTRIDIKKLSKKVYGGEININIKDNKTIWSIFNEDDQNKLNNIPGELFTNETPISESQYLGNLNNNNGKNEMLISKEPFNVDKNIIDKEFKLTRSTPIEGLTPNSNSMPLSDKKNVKNIINNNANVNNPLLRTPFKNGNLPMPVFQNNMIKNKQINMNLINQFQKNLKPPQLNQRPLTPLRQIISNNLAQNQLNIMQRPQINPPHGPIQYPHGQGPHPNMNFPSMGQMQRNQNSPNRKMQGNINNNQVQNNQLINKQNINNINQINNQILNRNNQNNIAQRNQVQNKLIQSHPNIVKQISNNQIPISRIQNNLIQNNINPINRIPVNLIPVNQNQNPNAQIINKFPTNPNIPQQQQNFIQKAITFKQTMPIQRPLVNQSKTPLKVNQYAIKAQNGQMLLNRNNINPNQINLNQGAINQIQNNAISQPIKQISAPIGNKKICSDNLLNRFNTLETRDHSPRKMVPVINRQIANVPINKLNGNRLGNQVALRTIQTEANNNNLNNNPRFILGGRNGLSPIIPRVATPRPPMMALQNNNRIFVPINT